MLFQVILKQLAIVFLILASMPLVISLLWKLRLLPLALCVVATELFFPKWAASHEVACLCLFAGSVLFAVLAWAIQIHRRRQERRYYEGLLLATAKPFYRVTEQGEYERVPDSE